MEKIVEQAFLYDFYGELLTDHQQEVYEAFILENLSLSEIAEERGISRQGVHDLVKRCDKILAGYESKLHLVEKFLGTKERVRQMNELMQAYKKEARPELLEKVEHISQDILEEL